MAVLTKRQYEEKQQKKAEVNTVIPSGENREVSPGGDCLCFRYKFLHPEIPTDGSPPSFIGRFGSKLFECENGIVATVDEEIAKYLSSVGYIQIDKKEIKDDFED